MVNLDLRWVSDPKETTWNLENPVAASHQALICVNPEGPAGNANPHNSAREIRESFACMASGHAFGKSHGMVVPDKIGAAPEVAPIHAQGFGWYNPVGLGNGVQELLHSGTITTWKICSNSTGRR